MNQPGASARGFALIAVIGLLALLLVFLVTVHGSVAMTRNSERLGRQRAQQAQAMGQIVAMHAASDAPASATVRLEGGLAADVQRRPLTPADPLWERLPGMVYADGDALVRVRWLDPAAPRPVREIVINSRGRRRGVILLGRPAASDSSIPSISSEPSNP
jgi:hypothetical protein